MWLKWRRSKCLAGRGWSSHGSWRDGSRAGALIGEHHPECAPCRNQWVQPNEGWNLISICLLHSPLAFQDLMSSPWDRGAPSFCLGEKQADSVGEISVTWGVGGFFTWTWVYFFHKWFLGAVLHQYSKFCFSIEVLVQKAPNNEQLFSQSLVWKYIEIQRLLKVK